MKIFDSIRSEIVNFYDFEEEKRADIVRRVAHIINSADKNDLIEEIRADFLQNTDSGIGVIYEAISHHADRWSDFIVEEYKRAFETAKKGPDAGKILGSLDEFSFVENKKTELGRRVVKILENHLTANNYRVRRGAVQLLGDWIAEDNKNTYPSTITKIQDRLQDDNWKVRYMAELTLTDMNALPSGFSRSVIDKLRVYFGHPFKD